jgi:hypothetical protein
MDCHVPLKHELQTRFAWRVQWSWDRCRADCTLHDRCIHSLGRMTWWRDVEIQSKIGDCMCPEAKSIYMSRQRERACMDRRH